MTDSRTIQVVVNGTAYVREVEPRRLLADFLREDLGLTGTHLGCEHGICGACTVVFNGQAVRSCLTFAVQADRAEILTVEGLAGDGQLHPLQKAFAEHHALQCGFCTPGMLMLAYDLLMHQPDATLDEIRLGMSANLCRCTGYRGIVSAVSAAATLLKDGGKATHRPEHDSPTSSKRSINGGS